MEEILRPGRKSKANLGLTKRSAVRALLFYTVGRASTEALTLNHTNIGLSPNNTWLGLDENGVTLILLQSFLLSQSSCGEDPGTQS